MSIFSTPPIGLPLLLGVKQKPYLIGIAKQSGTTTPMSVPLPARERDVLLVGLIAGSGGNSPSTPSGWTSLASAIGHPIYRIAYKFCDGSEAPTVSISQVSTTSLHAIIYALKTGGRVINPVHGGGTTATSATPNPGSVTGNTGKRMLFLPYAMWQGDAALNEYPNHYTIGPATTRDTIYGLASILRYGSALAEDAGAFTISASLVNRAGCIAIPSFGP